MTRDRVFISYPSDDLRIAGAVNEAILKMPLGRLRTFLDTENVRGGDLIPTSIQNALRETVYFVGIATNVARRSFDWCGLELGFYQGSFLGEGRREACLYHQTFPQLFSAHHNFKVQSLSKEQRPHFGEPVVKVEESDIFDFLMGLAELNAKLTEPQDIAGYYADVQDWCRLHAQTITGAFHATLQERVEDSWYPQGRIDVSVENGDFFRTDLEFPADAEVVLSPTTYTIIDVGALPARPIAWSLFKSLVEASAGHDLLCRSLWEVAVSALPSRANAKGDVVLQAADGNFYRVLLVKHSLYGSKRRSFTFNLIKTLEKVQSGSQKTTALVAGIVLGSKYRSLFLEEGAKYHPSRVSSLPCAEAAAAVVEMLRDLERIHADAAADGLSNHETLLSLLGDEADVHKLFAEWWEIFPMMELSAKAFGAEPGEATFAAFLQGYRRFIERSETNNREFLRRCIDAYREIVVA